MHVQPGTQQFFTGMALETCRLHPPAKCSKKHHGPRPDVSSDSRKGDHYEHDGPSGWTHVPVDAGRGGGDGHRPHMSTSTQLKLSETNPVDLVFGGIVRWDKPTLCHRHK